MAVEADMVQMEEHHMVEGEDMEKLDMVETVMAAVVDMDMVEVQIVLMEYLEGVDVGLVGMADRAFVLYNIMAFHHKGAYKYDSSS